MTSPSDRSSPLLLKSFWQTFIGNGLVCCRSAPNEVQEGHKQTVLQGVRVGNRKMEKFSSQALGLAIFHDVKNSRPASYVILNN